MPHPLKKIGSMAYVCISILVLLLIVGPLFLVGVALVRCGHALIDAGYFLRDARRQTLTQK